MKLIGKPEHVSREFLRSWLVATGMLMQYHNHGLDLSTLKVEIKKLDDDLDGCALPNRNTIWLEKTLTRERMAATIVHEMIHLAFRPGFDTDDCTSDERCTSTLTAKLKPSIAILAGELEEGTYRRAAAIALCRPGMAYQSAPGQPDGQNDEQDRPIGLDDRFHDDRAARAEALIAADGGDK